MTEKNTPWAAPREQAPPTTQEVYESAYAEGLSDDAEVEDMVMLAGGERKQAQPGELVYVKRGSTGKVELWHLTDRVSDNGNLMAESLEDTEVVNENGETVTAPAERGISAADLSAESQAAFAEEFARQEEVARITVAEQQVADALDTDIDDLRIPVKLPKTAPASAFPGYTPPVPSVDGMPPLPPSPLGDLENARARKITTIHAQGKPGEKPEKKKWWQ